MEIFKAPIDSAFFLFALSAASNAHGYVPKSATTCYQWRESFIDGNNKVTILAACAGNKKQQII